MLTPSVVPRPEVTRDHDRRKTRLPVSLTNSLARYLVPASDVRHVLTTVTDQKLVRPREEEQTTIGVCATPQTFLFAIAGRERGTR